MNTDDLTITVEDADRSRPYVVFAGWDDAPHLTDEQKREFLKLIPPHMRLARTRGIPYLGAGAIYPIPIDDIMEDAFVIPPAWPRCFGMDVGWKRTAALWAAWDRESDIVHLYSEHYMGQVEPLVHARAIVGDGTSNHRAKWIPGVIDPSARRRNSKEGARLLQLYRDLDLIIHIANNAVEAGIYEVWQRFSTGRLKIFRQLTYFSKEYCLYRRKEDGQIVKKNDHLMDCLRYLILSGLQLAVPVPTQATAPGAEWGRPGASANSWMGV